jgi:hypothetical protein
MSDPEDIWAALLSENPSRIRRVWENLTDDECQAVLAHIKRMCDDPQWLPAQQQAATIALTVIQDRAASF